MDTANPSFEDVIGRVNARARHAVVALVQEHIDTLVFTLKCVYEKAARARRPAGPSLPAIHRSKALASRLLQTYDPPGHLRPEGRRHDNDFADISRIRVVPTADELASSSSPYIPPTLVEAPHHLPANSMERHLDIQFRLLREELV